MLHALPEVKAVQDRAAFILDHVKGKRVLEFGASGPLTETIREAASEYFGVDRESNPSKHIVGFDLDDVTLNHLPEWSQTLFVRLDIIVCGEVLEHLGNPLWFLKRLREQQPGVPVLITVPNAFSAAAQKWLAKGFENVNADHVAWYSPKTLSVLLARAGYTCADLYYYNGHGPTAEGLIVVAE
jgi:2-polyprenyl-3-methyl-5-hydroxy-6-metoxy-1,4-benzoquinol methylase